MVVIGVTGGVGTGKSTVAKLFAELGAVVLDADAIAHRLMEPKRLVWRRTVAAFGDTVLNADQTINRRRLSAIVFTDPASRRRLEAIVHPQVFREMKRQLHALRRRRGPPAVVLDIPLLVETGAQELVDVLVVVTAPPDVQRRRVAHRFDNPEEFDARRNAQLDLEAKAALADHVVDNANGVEHTRRQVKAIWQLLRRPPARKRRRSSTSRR